MPSDPPASTMMVRAERLGKCYPVYARPQDRLRQLFARKGKRYYSEFWALRDLSFEIQKGECVGIVGRNGAGKSTLLQMIAGTLQPTEGSVKTHGTVTALLELGSGFNLDFTGRENVVLGGAILGIPRKRMEERIDAIAAFADIGEFIDRPVRTYSSGMFVRLSFSLYANLDPDLFIVDEALAVGDAYFRHRCMLRFHEMRKAGTTVLYVSHDAGSMKRLCDRVIWIEDGNVREFGQPDRVVDLYLASLFGIPVSESKEPSDPSEPDTPDAPTPSGEPSSAERHIPNVDRRRGDRQLEIVGVGLYDEQGRATRSVAHGSRIRMRATVRNQSLSPRADSWMLGYVLRNFRGEDMASTNSAEDGYDMPPLSAGEEKTVWVEIELPRLHPGSYSITPTAAYFDSAGEACVADWLDNALVFDVTSGRMVHSQFLLPSRFGVD